MKLKQLTDSGIKFENCSAVAIIEEGREDFVQKYFFGELSTDDLSKEKPLRELLARDVVSIFPQKGMIFIKVKEA